MFLPIQLEMALQKTSVEMKSSLQNPKTTLRRKLHQIIVQLISDIVLAVVDDFQLCIWCCRSAPDIGWSVAAHVDVHADKVVRLEEEVVCVLNIEIHTGLSGFVLVPRA